jgi:hypothetical protein
MSSSASGATNAAFSIVGMGEDSSTISLLNHDAADRGFQKQPDIHPGGRLL